MDRSCQAIIAKEKDLQKAPRQTTCPCHCGHICLAETVHLPPEAFGTVDLLESLGCRKPGAGELKDSKDSPKVLLKGLSSASVSTLLSLSASVGSATRVRAKDLQEDSQRRRCASV